MALLRNADLYGKHDQLIKLKRETYEKLYDRCRNKIKLTSDTGELLCFFEIPPYLFGSGYPVINVQSCANYIMNKLTQANKHINTTFIEPNIIFVDWRREKDMDHIEKISHKNSTTSDDSKSQTSSFSNSSITSRRRTERSDH